MRPVTPLNRIRILPASIAILLLPIFSYAEVPLTRIDVIGEGVEAVTVQPGSVGIVTREELELMQRCEALRA
jgi:hypothetical protein